MMISVVVVDWRCCCCLLLLLKRQLYTVNKTFSVKLSYYSLIHIGPNFTPYAEQQPYKYLIIWVFKLMIYVPKSLLQVSTNSRHTKCQKVEKNKKIGHHNSHLGKQTYLLCLKHAIFSKKTASNIKKLVFEI